MRWLSIVSIFNLYLRVRRKPTRVKDRIVHLTVPSNIRLGWKILSRIEHFSLFVQCQWRRKKLYIIDHQRWIIL